MCGNGRDERDDCPPQWSSQQETRRSERVGGTTSRHKRQKERERQQRRDRERERESGRQGESSTAWTEREQRPFQAGQTHQNEPLSLGDIVSFSEEEEGKGKKKQYKIKTKTKRSSAYVTICRHASSGPVSSSYYAGAMKRDRQTDGRTDGRVRKERNGSRSGRIT